MYELPLTAFLAGHLFIDESEIQTIVDIGAIQKRAERRHVVCIDACDAFSWRRAEAGVVWIPHGFVLNDIHLANVVFLHRVIHRRWNHAEILSDNANPMTMRLQ